MGETRLQPAGETHKPDSLPVSREVSLILNFSARNVASLSQCNELCNIARDLNSTAISKYLTLKMTDVASKHVW